METLETRSLAVRKEILENGGAAKTGSTTIRKHISADLKASLAQLDGLRKGDKDNAPIDITLGEFAKERWGYAPDDRGVATQFLAQLGIDPNQTSVASLMTMSDMDESYRWLIPEIFRDAARLGLRNRPIYPDLIRGEENISQMQLTMPDIKMSDALPKKLNELETITTGTMSFGSKTVKISKMGIGFDISDEAMRYSSLNMLAIYLEDVGALLGMGLDTMMIETIINGDQAGGGDSIATIGVDTTSTLAYKDLVRSWIRMQRIGNRPTAMIAGENLGIDVMLMDEFRQNSGLNNLTPQISINLKTALPKAQDMYVHGAVPANKIIMLSKDNGLIKLNSSALRVETERNAKRQFDSFYLTVTTGFATLKRDARLMIDRSLAFGSNGFPAFFDVDARENVSIV
jgi:hypothetical protein